MTGKTDTLLPWCSLVVGRICNAVMKKWRLQFPFLLECLFYSIISSLTFFFPPLCPDSVSGFFSSEGICSPLQFGSLKSLKCFDCFRADGILFTEKPCVMYQSNQSSELHLQSKVQVSWCVVRLSFMYIYCMAREGRSHCTEISLENREMSGGLPVLIPGCISL